MNSQLDEAPGSARPAAALPKPPLSDHFERASVRRLLERGHPYDFIETYEVLEALYGYRAAYVNLGLWDDGLDTVEAGRRLAFWVLDQLDLPPGGRLVDAGCGLGQCAIDACERHALGSALGINPNVRQASYARALTAAAKRSDRIELDVADASTRLGDEPAESVDGVCAVECIGHFPDPDGFLRGANRCLRPGARIAFCLNVAGRPLGPVTRAVALASYGFVPSSLERWLDRLTAAGFSDVRTVDLTDSVLRMVCQAATDGLRKRGAAFSITTKLVIRTQVAFARHAVERGDLRYYSIRGVKS